MTEGITFDNLSATVIHLIEQGKKKEAKALIKSLRKELKEFSGLLKVGEKLLKETQAREKEVRRNGDDL